MSQMSSADWRGYDDLRVLSAKGHPEIGRQVGKHLSAWCHYQTVGQSSTVVKKLRRKSTMNNIAIIQQGSGKYLFSLPNDVTLKEGDRVKCDTRRGITDGVAFADSAWVDENISQLIGKLTGAKFPLKSVVGRLEYLPFEKPQEKPAANPANKYDG